MENGSGRVYNLGSGQGTTVNELFRRLKSITGYQDEPVYAPAKVGETFKIYLNAQRAKEELGWSQTISLEEGLTQTVKYTRNNEMR